MNPFTIRKTWTKIKKYRCLEWNQFDIFKQWYLENYVEGLMFIRMDLNKDYSPTNCKFATRSEIAYKHPANKEKTIESNRKKYGRDYYSQTEDFKNQRKKTNIEKYGTEHPIHNAEIKKKWLETNNQKYGGNSPLCNKTVRKKMELTNFDKFGYNHAIQSDIVKDKVQETKIKTGSIHCLEGKTTKELAEEKGIAKSTIVKWIRFYGDEASNMKPNRSCIEQAIENLLNKHNLKYICNKGIGNYRPDFLIEDKLIIECDGLYWHSDAILKDDKYHYKKREYYIKSGYTPLFFREDEIKFKLDIIESIVINKIGKSNRIYARNCSINTKKNDLFFCSNHLMGNGSGKQLFLEYNGNIVAGIQYFTRNGINEISRFCTSKNDSVIGGFSKLISRIKKPISTFIDLRYGQGNYLESLGFKLISNNLSFKWCYGDKTYHRLKFKGNSGYDNHCNKIWDCGQAKYLLTD